MSARRAVERRVLLGPAVVRRAAAGRSQDPEERWMLEQPKDVRQSFVAQVLDADGDEELRRQIWMLGQPAEVRESFVKNVLRPALVARRSPD